MSQRWSLNEDIVVCKYCTENPWAYTKDADMMRYKINGRAARECNDVYYVAYEDGHCVGWSFDGEIQIHPLYKNSEVVKE